MTYKHDQPNSWTGLIDRVSKRIAGRVRKALYTPNIKPIPHSLPLIRLGTTYGGWSFVDTLELHNSVVVSCGLGEDASFDVELASRFGCKIIIVDPTPRAITHFWQLMERLGHSASVAYKGGGKQPAEAYDLSNLSTDNFHLVDKALWIEATTLRFFCPPNQDHVSHSIINFQNNYRNDSRYIEVQAITIDKLLDHVGIPQVPLMKIDIEGAEIEVLSDMMGKRIFPSQILVEYDELSTPSRHSKQRIESAHGLLLSNGYELINFDAPSNFLYVKASSFFP